MTDRELADLAWAELTKTTDSYPAWKKKGFPWTSHWAHAKTYLDQIGVTPPPPPPTEATFESATAHLDDPLPDLTGAITVASPAAFVSACANARAGQTINVVSGVKIPGQFDGFNRVIPGGDTNPVKVAFQPGAGFTGAGLNPQIAAFHLRDTGGWRVWGGLITNPNGAGILAYTMPGPFKWTGFQVKDTAQTCVSVFPVFGTVNGLILKGVAGSDKVNIAQDNPGREPGTGIHAWNLADASGGYLTNCELACDTLNQATGAAVEIQTNRIGANVKVYARAKHLGFALPGTSWDGTAHQQVAGNVIQLWGGTMPGTLDVAYAEGNNIQGRILETDGVGAGDISHAIITYGRATGPILQNPRLSKIAYAVKGGIRLGDVKPTP